ncbi:hypothetical protein BGW42_004447 [Actinomortierella wolfii]|nr:hypothetical protein BGW42_004447 [Actinomortierella wolfii]
MQRSPSANSLPFTTTPRDSPPASIRANEHYFQQHQQQQQQQQPLHNNDSRETHIYTLDYAETAQNSDRAHTPPLRQQSPTMAFSNIPLSQPSKWKRFRLRVMRMATVERLRILWGLLALVSTAAWLALMPAYAFRNKITETGYSNPSYSFFLVATVLTSVSATWQSLCPVLVRRSQRSLLPRIINHPWTQTATIIISVILTILNFLSWIVLAANEDGAKTDCQTGVLAKIEGYTMQCQAVNTAIALNAIVFLLWIPIAVVIVCGTIERGLWWWGEDDGAFADSSIPRGSKMMSEEEFDLKIGLRDGGAARIRSQGGENGLSSDQLVYDEVQVPKPAFVTPIAAQFKSSGAVDPELGMRGEDGGDDYSFTPSSYRRHHQQRQRQQQQQQQQQSRPLERRTSNQSLAPSLSSRLSSFFGAGWGSGPMPPPTPEPEPPVPKVPERFQRPKEPEPEPEPVDPNDIPGDGFATQWHSRRETEWS